ncbi:MAG: AbrB/MazE/SpoVT family DNA-binding domain-containing protein [Defluviitaleaceae bacterium]|nr:AbrB/MazE/SpoVT family DNA-binding domain-containing protein [Defluviitaleaceae bacterium]
MIYNTAKVMSKGQITLPIDMRKNMKLNTGDRVALIYENDRVIMMNPALHAMEELQKTMEGEGEKTGLATEKDIALLCREIRDEVEGRK